MTRLVPRLREGDYAHNPLFLNPKTVMLFGDAKESVDKLTAAVKGL